MAPSTRIPPLLQPHVRFPDDDSVILVTSTLGASANWLIVRFLCEGLSRDATTGNVEGVGSSEHASETRPVVLVSWMRDWEFWKSEARKGGGLDLERLKRDKKLAFVDGLSKLFLSQELENKTPQTGSPTNHTTTTAAVRRPLASLPARGPPAPGAARTPTTTLPASTRSTPTAAASSRASIPNGQYFLRSPQLEEFRSAVENACQHLQTNVSQTRPILVVDTPSFLLASNPAITPTMFSSTLLQLHNMVSHVVVHLPADDALISLSSPPQPLEIHAQNLLVKTAHMSRRILSCRVLDTGVAKDVSGVLRVTENSVGYDLSLKDEYQSGMDRESGRELLYLIKGDGSVKVFERGTGGEA